MTRTKDKEDRMEQNTTNTSIKLNAAPPQSACPACGYCPHCGRSAQPHGIPIPYYTQPYYWPTQPTWISGPWHGYGNGNGMVMTGGVPVAGNVTSMRADEPRTFTSGFIAGV